MFGAVLIFYAVSDKVQVIGFSRPISEYMRWALLPWCSM